MCGISVASLTCGSTYPARRDDKVWGYTTRMMNGSGLGRVVHRSWRQDLDPVVIRFAKNSYQDAKMPAFAPVSIHVRNRPDLTFTTERQSKIYATRLDKLNFGDVTKIREAREAISEMGWLDTFCDWCSYGGAKRQVLDNVATKVLCEKALAVLGDGTQKLAADVLHVVLGRDAIAGEDQVQAVTRALARAQGKLIDQLTPAGFDMYATHATMSSDGKTIEFLAGDAEEATEAHELLTLRWQLSGQDRQQFVSASHVTATQGMEWLAEFRISCGLRAAEDEEGASFLSGALAAGKADVIAAYGSLLRLVPDEERAVLLAGRDAYGDFGLAKALRNRELSRKDKEATAIAYGALLDLLPKADRASLLDELLKAHDPAVMSVPRLRALLSDSRNPAHQVPILDDQLSRARINNYMTSVFNLPRINDVNGDGHYQILREGNTYQLRAAIEVDLGGLKKDIEDWKKTANQKPGKVQIVPVGVKNRGFAREDHEVMLVCAPGKKPLIIDSKSGGTYPDSADVLVTGRQSWYDKKSCGSHIIQQCLHYAYMLDEGVPIEEVRPYGTASTAN